MTPEPPPAEPSPFDAWAPPAALTPEPERPPRRRPPPRVRRAAGAAGWLAMATLIALGGAGIVTATNRPPVAGARPELTWTVDKALEPELAAATSDLGALSDDVDAFGDIGREALTKLVDRDTAGLQKTIVDGENQLALIAEATAKLRARLGAIPGIGPDDPTRIGTTLRVRYDRLTSALSATDGLAGSWAALTGGSVAAIDLTTSLAEHDTRAAEAAKLGRKFEYKKALAVLDKADAALARSRQLRDRLANTTDVDILTRWIDRNAAFDGAVRKVWTLLVKSKGKITADVRAAFEELRSAQAALPPDSRAMIVIMADVARGGLNQAVIGIEEARGRLSAATEALGGG